MNISIVCQGNCQYLIFYSEHEIGRIAVSRNSFHNQHCYLKLELICYDTAISEELFSLLRQKINCSLQVMLYSFQKKECDFLSAGGFQCKRHCFEVEGTFSTLAAPVRETVPLTEISSEHFAYAECCKMLYDYYAVTHASISLLTANLEQFCVDLPDTVLCQIDNGKIIHFAFIEGNEIAYIGTKDMKTFQSFAETLLARMLKEYDSLSFECDDCDPAAMALKARFICTEDNTYDTYIMD